MSSAAPRATPPSADAGTGTKTRPMAVPSPTNPARPMAIPTNPARPTGDHFPECAIPNVMTMQENSYGEKIPVSMWEELMGNKQVRVVGQSNIPTTTGGTKFVYTQLAFCRAYMSSCLVVVSMCICTLFMSWKMLCCMRGCYIYASYLCGGAIPHSPADLIDTPTLSSSAPIGFPARTGWPRVGGVFGEDWLLE